MKTSYVFIDNKHKYDLNEGLYDTRYLSALLDCNSGMYETLGSLDASCLSDSVTMAVGKRTLTITNEEAEVLSILLNNYIKEQATTINKGE